MCITIAGSVEWIAHLFIALEETYCSLCFVIKRVQDADGSGENPVSESVRAATSRG